MDSPKCAACGIPMEHGFLLDNTYGGVETVEWAEGEPKRSFWTGLDLRHRQRLAVTTFRCPSCGLLASYAL